LGIAGEVNVQSAKNEAAKIEAGKFESAAVEAATVEPTKPGSPMRRWALAAFYYACVLAIVGLALPKENPAAQPVMLAKLDPDAEKGDATDVDSAPVRVAPVARRKAACTDCGVIESVRQIDSRKEIMEGCAAGDVTAARMSYTLIAGSQHNDSMTLADAVDGVIFGERGAKKVSVTTRYQMVVRFRDGSRHVFNEETPRTLRVGDRIQVIAALARTSS
jgi:outer membrane lipoprotein SlyB